MGSWKPVDFDEVDEVHVMLIIEDCRGGELARFETAPDRKVINRSWP
jgi:hypothetical protein